MWQAKNKYTDNKLAEEMDWIVLINDSLKNQGVCRGALGTLIQSYSGKERPLYATFEKGDVLEEMAVGLNDFRVLNVKSPQDLSIVIEYLKRNKKARI